MTPILVLLSKNNDLIVYDIQKNQVEGFITGHRSKIARIVNDKLSTPSFYSLSGDLEVIYWEYIIDSWVPRFYCLEAACRAPK